MGTYFVGFDDFSGDGVFVEGLENEFGELFYFEYEDVFPPGGGHVPVFVGLGSFNLVSVFYFEVYVLFDEGSGGTIFPNVSVL